MTAADIAKTLRGRRVGTQYMVRCPAHNDRNPSLSLRDDDGRVLAHCHAGCRQQDVIEALEARGLWERGSGKLSFSDRIERAYDYTDEHGALLYQVVRLHSPKDFRQRYPDPNSRDGWTWRKHPQQILYRLPEVLEAPIVFSVEGEKDVETMRDYGFIATTVAGGAKAPWLPSFTEALAGREVIIIPDNDAPGWTRAKEIARAILGKAARVIILDDIHRDGSKDISDWFAAGHSECELISLLDGVHGR